MKTQTEFETGAKTCNVNDLILFVENTQKLAELRDNTWRQFGNSNLSEFYSICVTNYNKIVAPTKFTAEEKEDFIRLYTIEYFEDWKYENSLSVADSSDSVLQVLGACIVQGNTVKLPPEQLERSLYVEVKNKLELIGGIWKGGKVQGFVFPNDPTELLHHALNGVYRNIKKEFQFFGTPKNHAKYLVILADIQSEDICLEPEAGQGAIVDEIMAMHPENKIFICEKMIENQLILSEKYSKNGGNIFVMHPPNDDFLELDKLNLFTKVIANPPFSKNQDIDHIRKMYEVTAPKGRIVSCASESWRVGNQKKQVEFREWLESLGAEIIPVKEGTFKDSGTMVKSCIIVINKPE